MSLHTTLRRFYAPEHLIKKERFLEKPPDSVSVYRKLLEVAWPATLESVLLGLVSFVDGLMVSTVGTAAIAAVGVTNQPRLLFFAVFFAMNIGITAIVSRRKGQGDRDGANECLAQAVAIALILGVVLCTVAIIVAEPLIAFAGADEDIFDDAVAYFRIIMAGMLFTSVGMAINAAQRGIGNTKISMITNIAANLTNCVFNYFLINGIWFFPALGVRGAAYATLLGNVVSFVMSLYSVTAAKGYLHIRLRHCFHLRRGMLALLARIGGSAGVEQVFMRIGFFAYSKMVAELSTADLSTHIICMNVINLSFTVGDGLGVAASALVGQNLGAETAGSGRGVRQGGAALRLSALRSAGAGVQLRRLVPRFAVYDGERRGGRVYYGKGRRHYVPDRPDLAGADFAGHLFRLPARRGRYGVRRRQLSGLHRAGAAAADVSVLLSARLRGHRRVDFARRGPIFAAFVLRRAFCGRKMDKNRSINPDKGV